jgi:poly(3-hydroxybutyrate) depolymerase
MTRNLKALGLALVAAFAMSAVAASAAQAEAAHFTATSPTGFVTLHATQDPDNPGQEFEVNSGLTECDIVTATGTAPNTAASVTVHDVTYTGDYFEGGNECEAFGLESEVEFNGCEYEFHAGTIVNPGTSAGSVDLVCAGENEVEIVVAGGLCTVSVPPQTGINGITYHTVETNEIEEITVEAHSSNIKYSESGACGSGTDTNGVYNGRSTVKAFEDDEGVDGNQVDVTITGSET